MPESSPQTSQPLLQEFLNLLREKKYSENSLQSHRLDLQKYLDWLGDGGEAVSYTHLTLPTILLV